MRSIYLADLDFDPDLTEISPRTQSLEPALLEVRNAIEWAEHLVFVYPTWWGTYPALMKGFLDRILQPGWAFKEISAGIGYEGLLAGRTAELITTMDTPALVQALVNKAPGRNAMSRATLGFCGIEVTRHTRYGAVNQSTPEQREKWLLDAETLGLQVSRGVRSFGRRARKKVTSWLTALRLQFYPMTFFAYLIGTFLASQQSGFDPMMFWLGYLFVFALEAATVFSNDLIDYESDRRNRFWGPFTGGSRILHEGAISRKSLQTGAWIMFALALVTAVALIPLSNSPWRMAGLMGIFVILAIGYTIAPLKLSYRTLGELDVGITHSFLPVLFGFTLQMGSIEAHEPWLISLPLFLSILPAIILSGVPDYNADQAVSKITVAVRYGIRHAFAIAAFFSVAAAVAAVALEFALLPGLYGRLPVVLIVVHASLLVRRFSMEMTKGPEARRIDGTIILALSFILWFCIIPLFTVTQPCCVANL